VRVAAALAAFVAGTWLLQQQRDLPAAEVLVACGVLAAAVLLECAALARRASRLRKRIWPAHCGVMLAVITLGASHAAALALWQLADELAFADEGRNVTLNGIVASLPAQLVRGMRFEFDVQAVETPDVHVPAHLSLGWYTAGIRVRPGERWRFSVRLRRPHGALNPGGFDLEAWMLERNLRASGYVRDVAATPPERLDPMLWQAGYAIDRLRDVLRERLQARLKDARYGGVLIALVLGDQRAIGEEDWLLFNHTGIAHLVSISGLHITMIAGLVALAVGTLWRRSARALALAPAQFAAAIGAMLGALGYCLIAGWGVPAQRTFFMLATVAMALLLRLATRPATTLALAAAVVTALDPWAVLAPGFWLSFGAVAAIFYAVHGRTRPAPGWRSHLLEAARTQWVVTVALVPLTVVLFQQVSFVSPLANAIAIPLVSLVVTPLSLAAACFVPLPEPLEAIATPLLATAHALMVWLVALLNWFVHWPGASVPVPAPPAWAALLAVLGAAWLLAPPTWPLRWAGAVWLVPLFLWPAQRPKPGELWVTALDVGQGSAVIVETTNNVLVFDAGPRYSPQADAGSRIVVPYLRWRGIGRIDVLVLSHLDSDHSGGAVSILKALDVESVWTSIEPTAPLLAQAGQLRRCSAGDQASLGQAALRVLHPTEFEYTLAARNTNARSCVVEVRLGSTRVLLTGDLPAAQERALLARFADIRADLVSAPHHGSRNSSSDPFVSATAPRWVAVQAGYRNRFGHPDASVVARYRSVGAQIVRTDFAGATQWRFGAGRSETVHRQRLDMPRYWHNQPGLLWRADNAGGADGALPALLDDEHPTSDASTADLLAPRD
jgi:competence protein ComEC